MDHERYHTTEEAAEYILMRGEKSRAVAMLPAIAEPKAGKLVKIK